jgi:hypothetical protein
MAGPEPRIELMSDDGLATISAFEVAWTHAWSLMCERVNAFVAKQGSEAKIPIDALPNDLTLDGAIRRLKVAVHRLRNLVDVPADFLRLAVGANLLCPITCAADVEVPLQQLANDSIRAGYADPWHCEIVIPNQIHAQAIQTWLSEAKSAASQEVGSGPGPRVIGVRIPPAKRTRPMSLKDAASLMGYTTDRDGNIIMSSKKAAESLRKAMDTGAIPFEKLTRARYVFSRDSFPKESIRKILPRP